mgnify:CR=1 FL=1
MAIPSNRGTRPDLPLGGHGRVEVRRELRVVAALGVEADGRGYITIDLKEEDFKKLIPMQRFGEPEEVAEVVAFLASEKSAYITGEVININGGLV